MPYLPNTYAEHAERQLPAEPEAEKRRDFAPALRRRRARWRSSRIDQPTTLRLRTVHSGEEQPALGGGT
jgi:hypothetical protein